MSNDRSAAGAAVWRLARSQHGVISRAQLLTAGLGAHAIQHRIERGRLYPIWRGVYAVGRPELSRHGRWMAAALACGPTAVLSHESAAELWGIVDRANALIVVSVRSASPRRRPGIEVHRRASLGETEIARRDRIPVTSVTRTLIDLACRLPAARLERAVNEADRLDLIDPERLRQAIAETRRGPGVGVLRGLLDRSTFRLTDSELERRFLGIVRRAGLPLPQTGKRLNGFRVDFFWPELGLVVETDGLRYHRTPAQQARDNERDQAHAAAGLTCLRFTHGQIASHPQRVSATLVAVARRLRRSGA